MINIDQQNHLSGKKIIFDSKWIRFGLLVFINTVILIAAYSLFVSNVHFSPDTYSVYNGNTNYVTGNFRHGRFFGSFLYYILNLFGAPYATSSTSTISHIIYLFICACFISTIVKKLANNNRTILVTLNIFFLIGFINPCFTAATISFPEMILVGAILTLMTLFSFCLWSKKRWHYLAAAFILITLASNAYAVYIEYFFIVAIIYTLTACEFKFNKKTLIEVIKLIVFTLAIGIVSIAISGIGRSIVGSTQDIYSTPSFSLSVITSNFIEVIRSQRSIIGSNDGLAYKGLFLACCFIPFIFALILYTRIPKGEKPSIIVCVLGLLAVWLMSFFPVIISSEVWLSQRTYVGLWLMPAYICSIFTYCYKKSGKLPSKINGSKGVPLVNHPQMISTILLCLSILCLLICIINVLNIQASTLKVNAFDRAQIEAINQRIDEYEQIANTEITELQYGADPHVILEYPSISFVSRDTNLSSAHISWSFRGLFNRYKNNNVELSAISPEEKETIFGNKNWDSLNLSEQLKFDENTAYLLWY